MYNMRQILLDEVKGKVNDKPRGEKLLIVTGDFRNYWDSDYSDATKFLFDLIETMDIDPQEDVFIIPGNHDVGSDKMLEKTLEGIIPDWKKHQLASSKMLSAGNMDFLSWRLESFIPYCMFARELGVYPQIKDSVQDTTPAEVHIRRWRNKLNILHLNTALIAIGKKKENQLVDIMTATDSDLWGKWDRKELPAIAIGHNSFYDLEKKQRTVLKTVFARRKISAYLCGDTHLVELGDEKQMIPIEAGMIADCQSIPNFVCAKSVADMTDTYSDFGFYWHEWDENTDEVHTTFFRWKPEYLSYVIPEGPRGMFVMRREKHPDDKRYDICNEREQNKDDELRTYLSVEFLRQRDSHPSFRLMKADEIDSRLFPTLETNEPYDKISLRGSISEDIGLPDSSPTLIHNIIRDSWLNEIHRNVVLTGEGGIGKTVTLFSLSYVGKKLPVPAIYIPMYELVDGPDSIIELKEYFQRKFSWHNNAIEALAEMPWINQPRILILLDGFNEIPPSLRRIALRAINDWYKCHPGAQLIAVSRPIDGMDLSQELAGNPISITLAPLDDTTVRNYLREAGRKVPPSTAPIWRDLRYPLFLNLYIKTGRLNGKSAATYPLRIIASESGGALIWNYLQRELLRFSNAPQARAEDWVIRCSVANEFILPYIAYRMVSAQRMDVCDEQAFIWIDEALSELATTALPKHLNTIWEKYRRIHMRYPQIDMFSRYIWYDTVLYESGILVSTKSAQEQYKYNLSSTNYVFMHQNFRDCLAGIYLVAQAEMASANTVPYVWMQNQYYLVLNCVAELIDSGDAAKLWEANRQIQLSSANGLKNNHTATFNLLELFKRNKKLFNDLDFSGMDLRGLSLTRYLRRDWATLPLFRDSNFSNQTRFDRCSFQRDGHTGVINVLLTLHDGLVVSGSDDNTLRVWDPATGQCLQVMEGHTDRICCAAILPDGKIISGSSDSTLRVWDTATGQCLQTLIGHTEDVNCVAVLPDCNVISGSEDKTIRVWNTATGKCIQTLDGHDGGVNCVAALPDGRFVSGSDDRSLRLWDILSENQICSFIGHSDWVRCVAVLPFNRIVSGSVDGSLRIWDISTGQCIFVMHGHSDWISCITVLPDGRVVSGSEDNTLRVWDSSSGKCLICLEGHTNTVYCIAVLPNGDIVSGSWDNTLRIWDPTTGQCVHILNEHSNRICCVTVLSDGRIVSGSQDRTVRVWDTETGLCLQTLEGHTNEILSVLALPDGRVVCSSDDHVLQVWDPATGKKLQILEGHTNTIKCIALLPNGRVVSGSYDNTLRVWDIGVDGCLHTLRGHTAPISCVAVLSGGGIISGSSDKTLRIWDPSTGQCLQVLEGHSAAVSCVAALPNGDVISGSFDGTLRVWDSVSASSKQTLKKHNASVRCVAVLPNGNVVSGSYDATLRVWNPKTGKCLQLLKGHTNWITHVAVLSNGQIVSGSDDRTLRVWDPETGQCLQTLEGHTDQIRCVLALPGGRVVSGSYDNTIRLWDTLGGKCIRTIIAHDDWNRCLAALPDGKIACGLPNNTLRIWDTNTGECVHTLDGHTAPVSCVLSTPSSCIVSGSNDNTLRIWNSKTGLCLQTLEGHTGRISCIAMLQNGNLVSGSQDQTLRIWDSDSGQCLQKLEGHTAGITYIVVLPDERIVSTSNDYTLRVWDAATGNCLQILEINEDDTHSVTILPDGNVALVTDSASQRELLELPMGQCLQTMRGHKNVVNSIAILQNGNIISGSDDASLRVWDLNTGDCLDVLESIDALVSGMDFSKAILDEECERLLWQNGATISESSSLRFISGHTRSSRDNSVTVCEAVQFEPLPSPSNPLEKYDQTVPDDAVTATNDHPIHAVLDTEEDNQPTQSGNKRNVLNRRKDCERNGNPLLEKKMISGINRELFSWAEHSPLYRKAIADADPEQKLLAMAVGPIETDRYIASHKLMTIVWRSHPELGLGPDYETLSKMEHDRAFYEKYRDHMTHMFKVFLMGLYLYEQNSSLHDAISRDYDDAAFLSVWILSALYHDIGYLLENENGTRDGEDALFTYNRLTASLSLPLTNLFPDVFGKGTEKGLQDKYCDVRVMIPTEVKSLTHLERKLDTFDHFCCTASLSLNPDCNPIKAYYDYLPKKREGRTYYDHGIISACILIFVKDALCRYMQECSDVPMRPKQQVARDMFIKFSPKYQEYVSVAAKAIALHNIKKSWTDQEAFELNQNDVTIGDFCISLQDEPIAYLLRLCDELQCWDRQTYASPKVFSFSGEQLDLIQNGKITTVVIKDENVRREIQNALAGVLDPPVEDFVVFSSGGESNSF